MVLCYRRPRLVPVGCIHAFEVRKMNGWRSALVTMIILLTLVSSSTAVPKFTGEALRGAVKSYVKASNGGGVVNVALGTFSRSHSVGSGMQQLRQEEEEEMSHSLRMSISTLAVLDVGGGVLFPIAQNVIDEILTKKFLKTSKEAFEMGEDTGDLLNFLNNPADLGNQEAAKMALYHKKARVKNLLITDLGQKVTEGDRVLVRKISKVKKLFKAAKFAKALGPIFDVINIGMSIDSLVRASIECHNGDTCNVGGIVSASLGIVSGIFGIVSVFVPVLAPLALVLGIAATLVEIFWQPTESPRPELNLEGERYNLNAGLMRHMDVYSRMQLEGASRFLKEGGLTNIYIYVVNQGHFPNWMEENISEPEEQLSGPLRFGFNEDADYDKYGILKETIQVAGQCSNTSKVFAERSDGPITGKRCDYFQEGNGDLVLDSRVEGMKGRFHVGPDFYGISQSPQHERTRGESMYDSTDGSTYEGVMVLVPTDRVTNRKLVGEEGEVTYTNPVRIRGLYIDTEKKLRAKSLLPSATKYNDVVAIGDMLNLGSKAEDGGHMVIVDTGNSGRDVLVIDGWVKKLEARLGLNHNTLSFRTISQSAQRIRRESSWDTSIQKNEIKGIKFNPGSGQVIMFAYDAAADENVVQRELGHVHGVGFLSASPFRDEITLFALQKDESNPNDHFSVYKYNGTATYIFDAKNYKSARFIITDEVHFKVLDGSSDCSPGPLLKIINMPDSAGQKYVQYKYDKVHIYSDSKYHNGSLIPFARITFVASCPAKVTVSKQNGVVVFAERLITDLDIMDYTGQRFDHYFSEKTTSVTADDSVVYVHCPASNVGRDNGVLNVKTVVVTNAFFDKCKIAAKEEDVGNAVDEEIKVTVSENAMKWNFPASTPVKHSQTFEGVERIVNELGDDIVDLRLTKSFPLYDTYLKHSGEKMAEGSNLSPTVKDNLKMCILKVANLNAIKRNVQPRRTEFNATDITNECE